MYQKFFTNTIENKFIKYLLHNTPLPIYPSVSDGDYIVKDCVYIYKTSLIKCTDSGILYNSTVKPITTGTITAGTALTETGIKYGEYRMLQPYTFGESYLSLTEKYISNVNYYDPKTHYALGRYLRFYRDIYGIDLMPFYNCFNYDVLSDIYLYKNDVNEDTISNGYVLRSNNKYKIISVPIKYNKTYTIAIDCSSPVLMKTILYGDMGMVREHGYSGYLTDYMFENYHYETDENNHTKLVMNKLTQVSSFNYNKPFLYKYSNTVQDAKMRLKQIYPEEDITQEMIDEDLKVFQTHEKSLHLIIQLPKTNNSTITVLEGDYSNSNSANIYNIGDINYISDADINKLFISNPKLLMMNNKSIYAFSDRLIEYLLLNVIDYQDDIDANVIRTQVQANIDKLHQIQRGVFDKNTRMLLYKKYIDAHRPDKCYDINGFVDKDMEKFLVEGV